MSMPALLSHFGITTARFVTSTGEIVFDRASHGTATEVANHLFHGGEEEADDGVTGPSIWWDDPSQLGRHIEAMERAFPEFLYVAPDETFGPCWVGTIDTGRGVFQIGVFPRRDQKLPRVSASNHQFGAPAGRRWQRSPHLYLSGNLCVADQSDWDPSEHTVANVAAWAAHWLAAYTEWRITRKWPVEGVQTIAS